MTPREIIAEWWPSRIPNARGIVIEPGLRDEIAGELLSALDAAGYEIVGKPIAPWAVDWSAHEQTAPRCDMCGEPKDGRDHSGCDCAYPETLQR